MKETKIANTELMNLVNDMIVIREEVDYDHLSSVFTEMPLFCYATLKRIWPEISQDGQRPDRQRTLQELQEVSNLPMNRVSALIKDLNNEGLVHWKRGDSGTYVELSTGGWERFLAQQERLMTCFDSVISRFGIDKFKEMLRLTQEFENLVEESISV